MQNDKSPYSHTIYERVAILETQMHDLGEIRQQLDQLLELKARGMGAIGLVGLVITSGVLGLVATFFALFKKSHF